MMTSHIWLENSKPQEDIGCGGQRDETKRIKAD